MIAELADHHFGGQKHRKLSQVRRREWNGDDNELAQFLFEFGVELQHVQVLLWALI